MQVINTFACMTGLTPHPTPMLSQVSYATWFNAINLSCLAIHLCVIPANNFYIFNVNYIRQPLYISVSNKSADCLAAAQVEVKCFK